MKNNTDATLAVKFCGNIDATARNNRENFRQSVIDTVLKVVRMQNVTIEYIAYQPDQNQLQSNYQDFVLVSLNMQSLPRDPAEDRQDRIIDDFIRVFESNTHKHLEIDFMTKSKSENKRVIQMHSNWNYYLRHA